MRSIAVLNLFGIVQRSSRNFVRMYTIPSGIPDDIIKEKKAQLRRSMRLKLSALTLDEKTRQSEIVKAKILDHDSYKNGKRVSIFLNTENEIQTSGILKDMFETGKSVFIPRYSTKRGRMDMVRVMSWEDYESLPMTKWNIKQPPMSELRDDALLTGGLDLIIVPGLAFNKEGHRLGQGKGYYDAFLTRCRARKHNSSFRTIGIGFREQLKRDVPIVDTDIELDEVITCDD